MNFPPSMWVNTKGKGGEAIAEDIQERARQRSRNARPPLKRWERVAMSLLLVAALGYLIVDKVL